MKKVLMLGTGGTIASDRSAGGLVPVLTVEQLVDKVPVIAELCQVTCLQLFSIDTMAYTAAALSYLVQYSPKPIVITGAQKPMLFEYTDSKANLADAFRCAVSDLRGVMIVFNGRVILGTRARKTHTTSFSAFASINYPLLAVVQDGFLLEYNRPLSLPAPKFYHSLDPKVGLMKMIPGADHGMLSYLLEHNDAVIIESYGVGGLPSYEGSGFFDVIKEAVSKGKIIVMTTQVQNEGSNLSVYDVGFHLKNTLQVLEAYDMTTEAVVAKLMWILAQTKEPGEVRRLFYAPVSHDLLYSKEVRR